MDVLNETEMYMRGENGRFMILMKSRLYSSSSHPLPQTHTHTHTHTLSACSGPISESVYIRLSSRITGIIPVKCLLA
jgi:hypothetical protein